MLNIAPSETTYLRYPFWSSYTLGLNQYTLALQLAQYQGRQLATPLSFLLSFFLLYYTSSDYMERAL